MRKVGLILLVEDMPAWRELLGSEFNKSVYADRICYADSYDSAMDKLRIRKCVNNILVADINLPEPADGVRLFQETAREQLATIFIAISSMADKIPFAHHVEKKDPKECVAKILDLIGRWEREEIEGTVCDIPVDAPATKITILAVGFNFDVEQQLEKTGYTVYVADVAEEALDDWRNKDYDLLLISPVLKGRYEDEEATTVASEQFEQDAMQLSPSRVLRIPPVCGENIEYILSEVQRCLLKE